MSSFSHPHKNSSRIAHKHAPNSHTAVIDLLPDGAFHAYYLPNDNVAVLAIPDALFADSHSFFEMTNKIRDRCASSLIIDLSSSAISLKESEQRPLKEQLSILLAVLFPTEFLRYRAVDAVNIPPATVLFFHKIFLAPAVAQTH